MKREKKVARNCPETCNFNHRHKLLETHYSIRTENWVINVLIRNRTYRVKTYSHNPWNRGAHEVLGPDTQSYLQIKGEYKDDHRLGVS